MSDSDLPRKPLDEHLSESILDEIWDDWKITNIGDDPWTVTLITSKQVTGSTKVEALRKACDINRPEPWS